MENSIEIWPSFCTCKQVIGDVGRLYRQRRLEGMSGYDAAKSLGLYKHCCLLSLNTPTLYDIKTFHTGRIKESVLNPQIPIHMYSLRTDNLAQLNVNLYKEPTPLTMSVEADIVPSQVIKGVDAPTVSPTFNISEIKRGDIVPTGYQLNDDGTPVLLKVGPEHWVPILTYIMKL